MKIKQYFVEANVTGYKMSIAFLTSAKTAREALEKTQAHIDSKPTEDGQRYATVKNRTRIATEKDIKTFDNFPESVLA